MKTRIFVVILSLTLSISLPISAKDTPKAVVKADTKNVDDVKTFDFEKIFAEAEKYFKAAESWKKIKCNPVSGFVCTKRECPKLKIVEESYMILDRKTNIISLCKNKICRYYPAEFLQTGVFINARVKNSDGLIIRVLGDSRFKEISMIGLDAYITNGNCTPIIDEKK